MARLWTSGAESRDTTGAGGLEGIGSVTGLAVDTTTFRSGAASWKIDSGAGNSGSLSFSFNWTGALLTNYYVRTYLRLSALGASDENLIKVVAGGTNIAGLQYNAAGTALVHTAGAFGWGSQVIAANTWYRVELRALTGTGAVDESELLIDGVQVSIRTASSFSDNAIGQAQFGYLDASGPGANIVMNLDDMAVNDSNGQAQNSWPGDGKVTLCLPISDNARATLWTGGAGGTTNLWDAVNNRPAAGLASASATNTSQIEHGGGAAGTTDAYDANMTTPANAGITAGDIAKVAQYVEADGEDVATGTKLLNFQVLSNPVIPSDGNVTVGNDLGAIGTYPTNWFGRRSASYYNLPLTSGTSPVMRVIRPETATRVASACFMGLLVESSGPEVVSNLYNTFEGGSNGTTISTANSGGDSGNAFNAVTISATAAAVFDNAHTVGGSAFAAKLSTGGTAGNCDLDWTTSLVTVGTTLYTRLYLYATANPGTSHRIWVAAPASGAHCISQITTTGKVNILTSGGSAIFTSTNSIALNQWVRIEYSTVATPTGTVSVHLFNNADSTVETESGSGANSGGTTQIVKSVFGISGTTVANVGPFWIDGIATGNNGGFFGPLGLPDVAMAQHRAA